MAEIVANGVRFHVQRFGEGDETVVFLHGLVVDNLASYYLTMAPVVARHAEVVLYDLRGHGRSERPPDGYRVEDGIADLDALLDELGLDQPVHLVGNSFGGVIALGMAIDHPERVASLLLIEAHFAVEGFGDEMADTLNLAAFGLDDGGVQEWLEDRGGRRINRLARNTQDLIYRTTLVEDLQAVRPVSAAEMGGIACPVVAFYGESSLMLPRGKELARIVPDCELHILPRATHSVLGEATPVLEHHLLARLGVDTPPPDLDAIEPREWLDLREEADPIVSRFLFVMPPLTGHVNPNVSVAAELTARGHSVAWCGDINTLGKLLPEGAKCYSASDSLPADFREYAETHRPDTRGPAAFKYFWEELVIPLALTMIPGVNAAVDEFRPDVLISDQQTLAGGAIAHLRGIPWATSASSSAELTRPFQGLPKVEEWIREQLLSLQLEAGLSRADAERMDLRFSDRLVLGFTTASLVGTDTEWPPHYLFVGPAISRRPERGDFPWERLDPHRPKVLVSLGTLNRTIGERFYGVAAEALGDLPVQGIIAADPESLGTLPDNVIAQSWVPQLALLEHMDAVVCHGGHNTTCEALAVGLPLVVAPIRDDQTIVAQQVVDADAGCRVRFGRVGPTKLGAAVAQVLEDPRFAKNAQRIADSFESAGGAEAAAVALEALVTGTENGQGPT